MATRLLRAAALTPILAGALVGPSAQPATATAGPRAHATAAAHAASVTIAKVTVHGAEITVSGTVRLPTHTAALRRRTLVWLVLAGQIGAAARSETFTARPNARDRFTVTHTTRLTGSVALSVFLRISGRLSGRRALARVNLADGGSGTGSTGPSTGSSSTGSSTTSTPPPASGPTTLDGTFELTAAQDVGGTVTGSWFEMFDPGGTSPLPNSNSTLANDDYTPLPAGTDGGLQSFAYQPAPNPAFAEVKAGKPVGNSLATDIIAPQEFEGYDFGVVTEATDAQTATADPLPSIVADDGALSGQLTAWTVGWNGQWFNQGTPKPDGSLPSGTTALSGAYEATTSHYTLQWKSLIVGGPFNGFLGAWHLEGTFVPAT